ncbi:MAG: carbon storage regulator CsrA [Legionella sp.]|jgi:carbon storage regulator
MLILSRKAGESIVLGDDVFITVLGFKGRQVSIGIDAPDALPIMRNEIYQKIEVEKQNLLLNSLRKCFPSMQNSINHYF